MGHGAGCQGAGTRVCGFGDWAPRRLGAQEPLRVGCPRVCIELMYQSSGYRTRFDIKQALTSINQPPPASSVLNDPDVWSMKVHDEIARSEAFGLRRHRQWGHNNGAMPHGETCCVRNIAACSETAQAHPAPPRLAVAQSSPAGGTRMDTVTEKERGRKSKF